MRQASGDGLAKIVAAEAALDEDFNTPYKRFKRFVGHHANLIALGLLALAAAILLLLSWLTREREGDVGEYAPEPPDDASPAVAYALAREGRESTNTVLATLLDLVDRGFYDTKEKTTDKEKLDLALKVSDERPPTGELKGFEREVLDFFDNLLGEKTIALSEMRDRIPQHSALWRGRWETMTEKLEAAGDDELSWDRDWRAAKPLIILGFVAAIVYVTSAYADVEHHWFGPVAIGCHRPARPALVSHRPPAADQRRAQRAGRQVASLRALDEGLPEARRRPALDARGLAADPDLRRRLRHRGADDRVGPDPRAGARRLDDGRPLEHVRVRGLVQRLVVRRVRLQLRLLLPGRAGDLLERRRGRRLLGRLLRRWRVLRRRRRRLVVSAPA